ncbi:hypothetical protein GGR50DRAFT_246793 [Xylaria sp. CBS 124048]|nr:hypothetical protein GGR50DRAFT_246793 [Xylaria sp. CBS 124048]
MDALKQSIAEIDSAIIEARQWVREARTDEDTRERQMQLDKLESDLINQQAKLDARMLEEEKKSR